MNIKPPNIMLSNKIEEYKKKLKLTKRQQEILIGTLLGDGHLESSNCGRTYRLKTEHSVKQKEYVDWLYKEFQEWVRTVPQESERSAESRIGFESCPRYWFNTLSSGSFRFYAQQFYRGREKVVPQLVHRWLTPLTLAVWYMDDGSIKSNAHRTVLLNTHAFNAVDLKRLQKALLNKFGIKTSLRKQSEGIQIYLLSETVDIFLKMIEPIIIPSMRYKLPKVWLTHLPKK